MDAPDLHARDRACVWHPYAAPRAEVLTEVVSAHGVRLRLADGREVIDGMSSWWAAIHGYGHPAIVEAMRSQLGRMSHVMFGGITHEPAVQLCEQLVALTPEPLTRVFLSDSGSIAVEVALKLALQYAVASGTPARTRFLTVRGGYHGDTFGAMSVTDPVGGMHSLFRAVLPVHLFAEAPGPRFGAAWDTDSFDSMERLIAGHAHELAAVILEPVVQGAGGMRFYNPAYLQALRACCDAHRVLLIFDEIATGFGRTGELFAAHHAGVSPDIMCLGKALTGGAMTLAATLCSDAIADVIGSGQPGVFMHGPTFMANPLACSAALASIALLLAGPWRTRVAAIATQLETELAPLRHHPAVADVRVLGAIGVVELREPVVMATIQPRLVDAGVWLRPFGRLLYTMPPFVIEPDELSQITRAMAHVLDG